MKNINIVIGTSGTGKTTLAEEKIKALAKDGKLLLVFVPDQFSFETERRLYSVVGARYISNVKVTSFAKISREILTEYHLAKPYATDTVKRITMLLSLENLKESLVFYRSEKRQGLIKKLLKTVASFKNAGLKPSELSSYLNSENAPSGVLFDKLSDLSMIYRTYDELLTKSLDDRLDDVPRAVLIAAEHESFNGKICFFDNFDSFSEAQLRLLDVIFSQASEVTVCLTTDAEVSRDRRFFCINNTIDRLKKLGRELSFTLCDKKYRKELPEKYYLCESPYDESRFIAAQIRRIIMDPAENARYRDFLILTADKTYAGAVSSSLSEYEIPSFSDFPEPLTTKPAVMFILTVLRALSFETEDIMRYVESGFTRVTVTDSDSKISRRARLQGYDISRLRKAVLKYSINRECWLNGFLCSDKSFSQSEKAALLYLEPIRKELIDELCELKSAFESAQDGSEMTKIFVRFLINTQNLDKTFIASAKADSGEETSELLLDPAAAAQYLRIWETLTQTYEAMVFCLEGSGKMSVSTFYSIVSSLLNDISLANPPKTLDCVTVGDIERSRKASPKYVFVCGMNEGVIPRKTQSQSVLTADETETLGEKGIQLGDTRIARWSKELYFTYRALSAAQKSVIVTASLRDFSGKEMLPSSIIESLKLEPSYLSQLPRDFFVSTNKSAKSVLADCYNSDEKLKKTLIEILGEKNEFVKQLQFAADFSTGKNAHKTLSKDLAKDIFNSETPYSPTAVETAFGCEFSYFCKYGLGIKDESGADAADPSEIGNAFHTAMENIIRKFIDKNDSFNSFISLSDSELCLLCEEALIDSAEKFKSKSFSDADRDRAIIFALKPRLLSVLKQLKTDIKSTGFIPLLTEKEVKYKITGEKCSVLIKGRADRIDVREENGEKIVRICDYKTGNKEIDYDELVNGIGLQMFLYLFACSEKGSRSGAVQYVAAGIGKPSKTVDENGSYADWLKAHRINGTSFGDEVSAKYSQLNSSFCAETGAGSKSKFVDMKGFSSDDYEKIKIVVETLIEDKAAAIQNGEISAIPLYYKNDRTACDYCRFKYFCGNKNGIFINEAVKKDAFDDTIGKKEVKSDE